MAEHRVKLTKRAIDGAPVPTHGELWLWDTELVGFLVRIRPSGRKVYALRYRLGKRQNTYTIGAHGSPWTVDEARAEAFAALARVRAGDDPNAAKRAVRNALTVDELIDAYLTDGPGTKPSKRASTWAIDASNLKRHVRPLLGRRIADSVNQAAASRAIADIAAGATARDIRTGPRGRARITGGEGTARRTRITAAAMYAWGVEQGIVKTNPFAAVKLPVAPLHERFLSDDEAARLLDAVSRLEQSGALSTTFGDAIRMLLLTGARKTEILALRWREIDWSRNQLRLPPQRTKTGGKTGERRIVLCAPAIATLDRRHKLLGSDRAVGTSTSEYVFPAARGKGHAVGLRKAFETVIREAKIDRLRVHDLRHSFASFAIADGASLLLVGKLLGHTNSRTTERYAHLSSDPLQDAAAAVGRRFSRPTGDGQLVRLEQAVCRRK